MMMALLEQVGERERTWLCVFGLDRALGSFLLRPTDVKISLVWHSVDLFVRESNDLAIKLYESLGYIIYRRVLGYYGGSGGPDSEDEDGFGTFLPPPRQMTVAIFPNRCALTVGALLPPAGFISLDLAQNSS